MAMTSGRLAKASEVGVETLRFYEREGLLPEPARTSAGYRQYPEDAVDRIRFIRRAQALGFELRIIRELLVLREDPQGAGSGDVRAKAIEKLKDIDRRIADLQAMKLELAALVARCDGSGPVENCPIMSAMDDRTCQG